MIYLEEYTTKMYNDKLMVHWTNKLELLMVLLLYECFCVCMYVCVCMCVLVFPACMGTLEVTLQRWGWVYHCLTTTATQRLPNSQPQLPNLGHNTTHLIFNIPPLPFTLPSYKYTFPLTDFPNPEGQSSTSPSRIPQFLSLCQRHLYPNWHPTMPF